MKKSCFAFETISDNSERFKLIAYYFFNFVTDEGFTLVFHEEAGKPFVTNLIGDFVVLFIFSSVMSLLVANIFYKEK